MKPKDSSVGLLGSETAPRSYLLPIHSRYVTLTTPTNQQTSNKTLEKHQPAAAKKYAWKWRPYKVRPLASISIYAKRTEMALSVPTKSFLQMSPDVAMLFAPFGCTHLP